MFFVGFEIDLQLFRKTKNRAVIFGFLTFIIPLAAGIGLGRAYAYSWNASLLIAVLVAAEGAQFIHLEGIVGAFLVGIALKRALRGNFAVEQLEVAAHARCIPSFFLATGFLVDFAVMKRTIVSQPGLVLLLIAATIGGKSLAAWVTGQCFRFQKAETQTMASLSFPQMAATLASAVVGYQAMNGSGDRLLDRGFINAVVMLVIFTCVVGPILTERFAQGLPEGKHPNH